MRGRCDKQEFCLRSRAIYTAKRRLPSVSRDCIFAAQSLFFPSQNQYFFVEIVWDKRWQVVHAWIIEDEHSCDEVLKAGRYIFDEGKKCQ